MWIIVIATYLMCHHAHLKCSRNVIQHHQHLTWFFFSQSSPEISQLRVIPPGKKQSLVFTLEEIILELFSKEWQSHRNNWVANSHLEMKKLRFRESRDLPRVTLCWDMYHWKLLATLKTLSGWTLSYSSLYSPQNLCIYFVDLCGNKKIIAIILHSSWPIQGQGWACL